MRRVALLLLLAAGCPQEDKVGFDDGKVASGAEWVKGDCAALGATTIAAGGCYIACSQSSQCTGGSVCQNAAFQPYCRIASCNAASECGPTGWVCAYGKCYLACAKSAPGVQAPDCPTGLQCSPAAAVSSPSCQKLASKPGSCGTCKLCYQDCSSNCTGINIPPSCNTTCMAACDKCCY